MFVSGWLISFMPGLLSPDLNIALYVQHLLGTGHLVRIQLLADALHNAGHRVSLISGGSAIAGLAGKSAYPVIQLNVVKTRPGDFVRLLDERGNPVDDRWKQVRKRQLLEVIERISPDVMVLETWPFGRGQMEFEIVPMVDQLSNLARPPMLVASIRDVLQLRKPKRRQQTLERLARYFSLVLVHGDPDFLPLQCSFPEASKIPCALQYTGYIAPPVKADNPDGVNALDGWDEVVVSAGGGAAGINLLEIAAQASEQDVRKWRLLVGPNIDHKPFNALVKLQSERLTVERNRPDFASLLKRCAVSVSQFGYNTAIDLVTARCPAVIVPYSADGETEQSLRAQQFAGLGYGVMLTEAMLEKNSLWDAIRRAGQLDRSKPMSLNTDGASTSVKILQQTYEAYCA